jgi:hypothetical protein
MNWQIKSQNAHFDDYNIEHEELKWSSESDQNLDNDQFVFYDDEEYYENQFYEEILTFSVVMKSKDAQSTKLDQDASRAHFDEIIEEKLAQITKSSQLILKCHQCNMKFYSNNKLHKHLRKDQHSQTQHNHNAKTQKQIKNISIVISTREHKNHQEFVFREHQYARVYETFDSKNTTHELCADSRIFMFLIDRKFLKNNVANVENKWTKFNLKMRRIDFKTHDTSKYCFLDLYFREHFKEKLKIAHIQEKFHLMNDLNVNMLIDIDITRLEDCILNFKIKIMIFSFCKNIEMLIIIIRIDQLVNRSLLIADKIVMSSHTNMTILVKIRKKSLSERNYIFNSKREILLDSEEDFFSHILINNSVRVLIKNTSSQIYMIFKNYRLRKINDYHKNESFLISSKNRHLTIASNKFFKQHLKLKNKSRKTVLLNDIIVHENEKIVARIVAMMNEYLNVWKNISETVNVSKKRWMKIKIILETNSQASRVYKLEIENQAIIDKEFDALHALKK